MSSRLRSGGRAALFLACVVFSVTAVYNVVADNADVQRAAEAVACGDAPVTMGPQAAPNPSALRAPGCRAAMTRMERTPIAQTFGYATGKRNVDVRCARALILVGEYRCELR